MNYRKLGRVGPTVSALGLGCMGMSPSYGPTDDKVSAKVISSAYEEGITFFDTADMYGNGANEKLLGSVLSSFRDKVTIATKCGIKFVGNDCLIDNNKQYIKQACEASLKRLDVDEIDLYYLHRHNPETPLEESMTALLSLVQEGKVKYLGLSEVGIEIIEQAHAILGDKLVALQTEYSIANPHKGKEVLATCRKLGISLVPYSPLGRGLLSGKIREAKTFTESTALEYRQILPQFYPEVFAANLKLTEAIERIAKKKGCTPAQLSLAWLLAQGDDIIPIPGTKKIEYLKENIDSLSVGLNKEELALIEKAKEENPISGARYPEELMKLFHLES